MSVYNGNSPSSLAVIFTRINEPIGTNKFYFDQFFFTLIGWLWKLKAKDKKENRNEKFSRIKLLRDPLLTIILPFESNF